MLDIARQLLTELGQNNDSDIEENKSKLEQLKTVLEMWVSLNPLIFMMTCNVLLKICVTFLVIVLQLDIFNFYHCSRGEISEKLLRFLFSPVKNRCCIEAYCFSFNFNEKMKRGHQMWIFYEVLLSMKFTLLTWQHI